MVLWPSDRLGERRQECPLRGPMICSYRSEPAIRGESVRLIKVCAFSLVVPSDATLTRHDQGGEGMAYVRIKRMGDREYYQVVESRRVEGKPRQKVLLHLGRHPTVDEALRGWPKEIRSLRDRAVKERESGKTWPETSRIHREILKRVKSEEKRAEALEANLQTLRDVRERSVV